MVTTAIKPNQKTEGKYMKKLLPVSIIAGLLAVSMIAGCSAKNASDPVREHNYAAAGQDSLTTKTYSVTNGMAADAEYEYGYEADFEMRDMAETAGSVSGQVKTEGEVNIDPEAGRLLIRTVTMSAETKEFDRVKTDVEAQIKFLGGYIEYSSIAGTGNDKDLRTAYYQVRIPADQLDTLLEKVGNSCTIISSGESTSDVTLEYVDSKARVESLRVEYDQLLELLDNAQDLDTIIVLQNRLSDVRYEIECYESRIRVLENQVTYATLNLSLTEVLEETEVEEPHVVTYQERVSEQFADTWENTKIFFQDLLLDIIAAIPGLIVFAVFIIAGLIVLFVFKSKRKKARKALKAKQEAEALAAEKKAPKAEEVKEEKAEETEKTKDNKAEEKE